MVGTRNDGNFKPSVRLPLICWRSFSASSVSRKL